MAAEESFDPFGWKSVLKDSLQGFQDELSDKPPSKLEEKMMSDIFKKFDLDEDNVLNLDEFNALQVESEGEDAVYNKGQMITLLETVDPLVEEPEKGITFELFRKLYVDGRLRRQYQTDVLRDYTNIFGAIAAAEAGATLVAEEKAKDEAGVTTGSKVVLEGLTGAKELNGQEGTIAEPEGDEVAMVREGRIIVQLTEDGERVAVKPANIKPQ